MGFGEKEEATPTAAYAFLRFVEADPGFLLEGRRRLFVSNARRCSRMRDEFMDDRKGLRFGAGRRLMEVQILHIVQVNIVIFLIGNKKKVVSASLVVSAERRSRVKHISTEGLQQIDSTRSSP